MLLARLRARRERGSLWLRVSVSASKKSPPFTHRTKEGNKIADESEEPAEEPYIPHLVSTCVCRAFANRLAQRVGRWVRFSRTCGQGGGRGAPSLRSGGASLLLCIL